MDIKKAVLPLLLCCLTLPAKAIESPFNGLTLSQAEKADSYSFGVGGHLYGASKNHNSVFPSSSFLGNIDRINSSNISFFVSLGDNFRRLTEEHIGHFKSTVASRLKMPFFNAVGNHDVTNRERYEAHFGKTYYDFIFGNELFIILDTEWVTGDIAGNQLDYLFNAIQRYQENPDIRNVFIFSHKLIWAVDEQYLAIVLHHLNNQSGYPSQNHFKSQIKPNQRL